MDKGLSSRIPVFFLGRFSGRELGEGLDGIGFEVFVFEIFEVLPRYYMTAPPPQKKKISIGNIFEYTRIYLDETWFGLCFSQPQSIGPFMGSH